MFNLPDKYKKDNVLLKTLIKLSVQINVVCIIILAFWPFLVWNPSKSFFNIAYLFYALSIMFFVVYCGERIVRIYLAYLINSYLNQDHHIHMNGGFNSYQHMYVNIILDYNYSKNNYPICEKEDELTETPKIETLLDLENLIKKDQMRRSPAASILKEINSN